MVTLRIAVRGVFNANPRDLIRICSRVAGTRIQAASDDLLETDKPVAEIALEHGFYDQSAFTRQFRQHTGETPLVFRRLRRRTREA